MNPQPIKQMRIKQLDILVFVFSLYLLFSLILQSFVDLNEECIKLLVAFDFISCFVFLTDWIVRLRKAESKVKYVFNILNIIDLLASIPFLFFSNYMGYFKLIRLLKLIKIIKTSISIIRINADALMDKGYILKMAFLVIFLSIIIISPILILNVESEVGNIKTAEDAVWWTYCTISTIGYGDKFPVTGIGRIITVFVSLGGISLFGLATGIFINYFFNNNKTEES